MTITIEIMHSDNTNGAMDVGSVVDMDTCILKMPDHIRIGQRGFENHKIENYGDQVDEYDIWLEEQILGGNTEIMEAIDQIYSKAVSSGVILKTRCCPAPYITHAHVVKRTILKLAGE